MTTQNTNAVNPSVILPFAAICNFEAPTTELDPDFVPSVFVSASHVVGTLFNSESEAKQAAIAYSNTHPCIAYLVYQQAVNASKIAQECRTTASVLSADIGLYVVEVN